jgi:ABC-2 type transport system permease protein
MTDAVKRSLAHARMQLLDLFRSPGYVVPTVGFPALFFALFALPYARTSAAAADQLTLSYIAFAVVGVTLYQFGVGIAAERGRPWERYLRTLPVATAQRFAARIVAASVFALLAAAVLALVARLFTPVDLSLVQWVQTFVCALLGGVPFVLFGVTIGYWTSAKAAVPTATACNLILAFAGGLWMPPELLPRAIQAVSPYLPTRAFGELMWSIAGNGDAARAVPALLLYAGIFAALASIGYRRDERVRYA